MVEICCEQRAIEIVQKAIDEDVNQNYAEAYKQYQNALDYFMMALKCTPLPLVPVPILGDRRAVNWIADPLLQPFIDEKNDKLRVLIRKKVDEYLDRAEKLKTHIAKAETKTPGVIGSNGKVTGGGKCVSSLSPFDYHAWLTRLI